MEPAPGFADAHLPGARRCVQCAGAGETRGPAGSGAVEARLRPATLAAGEGRRNRIEIRPPPPPLSIHCRCLSQQVTVWPSFTFFSFSLTLRNFKKMHYLSMKRLSFSSYASAVQSKYESHKCKPLYIIINFLECTLCEWKETGEINLHNIIYLSRTNGIIPTCN